MTAQPTLLDLLDTRRPSTPKAPRNQWLTNHLTATGHLTETGLTRKARIRTCSCGTLVLAGLDDDQCAFEAHADPVPLNTLGEMLAHLEHRHTYELRREGSGWVLDYRDHHRITWAPAQSRPRTDVLRAHHCGTRPVSDPETADTTFGEIRPTTLPPGGPAPF